jgi:hypothetical protein
MEANGTSIPWKWLAVTAVSLLFIVIGLIFSLVITRLTAVETHLELQNDRSRIVQTANNELFTALQLRINSIEQQQAYLQEELNQRTQSRNEQVAELQADLREIQNFLDMAFPRLRNTPQD